MELWEIPFRMTKKVLTVAKCTRRQTGIFLSWEQLVVPKHWQQHILQHLKEVDTIGIYSKWLLAQQMIW